MASMLALACGPQAGNPLGLHLDIEDVLRSWQSESGGASIFSSCTTTSTTTCCEPWGCRPLALSAPTAAHASTRHCAASTSDTDDQPRRSLGGCLPASIATSAATNLKRMPLAPPPPPLGGSGMWPMHSLPAPSAPAGAPPPPSDLLEDDPYSPKRRRMTAAVGVAMLHYLPESTATATNTTTTTTITLSQQQPSSSCSSADEDNGMALGPGAAVALTPRSRLPHPDKAGADPWASLIADLEMHVALTAPPLAQARSGESALGTPFGCPDTAAPAAPHNAPHARAHSGPVVALALAGSGASTGGLSPAASFGGGNALVGTALPSLPPRPSARMDNVSGEDYVRTRAEAVERYRAKRARRAFTKKIRYQLRKLNADRRPRIKGRFVKKEELHLYPHLLAAANGGCGAGAGEFSDEGGGLLGHGLLAVSEDLDLCSAGLLGIPESDDGLDLDLEDGGILCCMPQGGPAGGATDDLWLRA